MHSFFSWDLKKARKEGLIASIGQRMTTGPLLRVAGHVQTADAVSDPITLSQNAEIEIEGRNGTPSTFILTATLIANPQIFIGYHRCGLPLFLGVKRALEGHTLFLVTTRSGKTTDMAGVIRAGSRHG